MHRMLRFLHRSGSRSRLPEGIGPEEREENMRAIKRDAWEFETDEQTLLALAGNTTFEEYMQNRQQRAEELLSILGVQSHHRAFEIGSGDGTVAKLLSEHCRFIDCNDVSATFLKKAQTNCASISNVVFHQIRTGYLDYLPSESCDFGYSLNVFIHFNPYDIFNYLQDVQRILKADGLFYFDACTIEKETLELFHTYARFYKDDPTRVRGLLNFNHPELIRTILEDVGLHVADGSYMGNEGWLKVLAKKVVSKD